MDAGLKPGASFVRRRDALCAGAAWSQFRHATHELVWSKVKGRTSVEDAVVPILTLVRGLVEGTCFSRSSLRPPILLCGHDNVLQCFPALYDSTILTFKVSQTSIPRMFTPDDASKSSQAVEPQNVTLLIPLFLSCLSAFASFLKASQ